jgi:predicted outer membrane repeat protein
MKRLSSLGAFALAAIAGLINLSAYAIMPAPTVSLSPPALCDSTPHAYEFNVSQEVTGFDLDDIQVDQGELSAFSKANDYNYCVSYIGPDEFEGEVTLTIPAGSFVNASDVENEKFEAKIHVDTLAPRINSPDSVTSSLKPISLSLITIEEGHDDWVEFSVRVDRGSFRDEHSATISNPIVEQSSISHINDYVLARTWFEPDSVGNYEITITVEDNAGNIREKIIPISVTVNELKVTSALDTGDDQTNARTIAEDMQDGDGLSLREAIHWSGEGDTIVFDLDPLLAGNQGGTITLSTPDPSYPYSISAFDIDYGITINGDVDGNGTPDVTLMGNHTSSFFMIFTRNNVTTLEGLVMQNGGGVESHNFGAIYAGYETSLTVLNCDFIGNASGGNGGAIYTDGDLAIINSIFDGNTAPGSGGAIFSMNYDNNLSLLNSTLMNNSVSGEYGSGGAIHINGGLLMVNSTLSNNEADYAGGLNSASTEKIRIINSTIFDNKARLNVGGISSISADLGIYNSVIAGNKAGEDDIPSNLWSSQGTAEYSVSDTSEYMSHSCDCNLPNQPLETINLGPLTVTSGSRIPVHLPLARSILINAGSNHKFDQSVLYGTPLDDFGIFDDNKDAIGNVRIVGSAIDIGAVESGISLLPNNDGIIPILIEGSSGLTFFSQMTILDNHHDAMNSGAGNYSDVVIEVAVVDTSSLATDVLSLTVSSPLTLLSNSVMKNGAAIATIDSSQAGRLRITLSDTAGEIPTKADITALLQSLTYASTNRAQDQERYVKVAVSVTNSISHSTSLERTIYLKPVNDAPTLTATATNPTFRPGDSPVTLFSSVVANTVEGLQEFTGFTLTIDNVSDGEDEIVHIDGETIPLAGVMNHVTQTNQLTVIVTGNTSLKQIAVSKMSLLSASKVASILSNFAYENTNTDMAAGSRPVTITSLTDNGRTDNGGVDTAILSIVSTVTLALPNQAPTISGTPAAQVNQGATYTFTPQATDSESDTLAFSISNKPSWATFDTQSGKLSGTPTNADVGVTENIVISVSDAEQSVSLAAFDITVVNVNDAPTISGTPATSIKEGDEYSFTPSAADIDMGDTLSFSITNKPTWATFNQATGELRGTAPASGSGTTSGIIISVSNGTVSVALPVFDITVVSATDPSEPVLTAPLDIRLNASGLYTAVNIKTLLGLLQNAPDETVNAALMALATDGIDQQNCCITYAEPLKGKDNLLLPPGRHEITWVTQNLQGKRATATQVVSINPLVALSPSQDVRRGKSATFSVLLNGPAPSYPFTVDFVINTQDTTATNAEHDLANGVVTFTSATQRSMDVSLQTKSVIGLPDTHVVIELASTVHQIANTHHTITLTDRNLAPRVDMELWQRFVKTNVILDNDIATAYSNLYDDSPWLSVIDWTMNGLREESDHPGDGVFPFDPSGLSGVLTLHVDVTDSEGATTRGILHTRVVSSLPTLSTELDSDNDGISDADEGFRDANNNGIPDYLDNMPSPNVIPQQISNTSSYLLECDAGVTCGLGVFARGGDTVGVLIPDTQLATLATLTEDPEYQPVGGVFDFEIRGLARVGQSVRVAIPQIKPIPKDAHYRKFINNTWVTFVSDDANYIHSAPGLPGYCPAPGASAWTTGLTEGHWCVQLTIEDGGPNDADGFDNRQIADPGVVSTKRDLPDEPPAVKPPVSQEPQPKPSPITVKNKGGGSVDFYLLLLVGALMMSYRNLITKRRALAAAVLVSTLSVSTQAHDHSSVLDNTFVRADIYQVDGVSAHEYQSEFNRLGYNVTVNELDTKRDGYQLSLGYQWYDYTYTEIGFLHLGEVLVDMTIDGETDFAAFQEDFQRTYPATSYGITAVQGLTLFADKPINVSLEGGAYFWWEEKSLNAGNLQLGNDDGIAPIAGIKVSTSLGKHISLGLTVRRIYQDTHTIDLQGLSASYAF